MAVTAAIELVDLAMAATTAYGRPDLGQRLAQSRQRLLDPSVRVLVVGEFKQGKSQLVNALVNAPICPVDDDLATAVPTVVRHADTPSVTLVRMPDGGGHTASGPSSGGSTSGEAGGSQHSGGLPEGGEPEHLEVPVEALAQYVSEAGNPGNRKRLAYAEIGIPRAILADGLVLVDTPGVGGLASSHGAATMATLPSADAVLLVSDAAQEYTAPELDFLDAARRLCPNVACVLTKIDLYPRWRRIAELDRTHLATAEISAELLPVSSMLRLHAVRTNDKALNAESGFRELISFLRTQVVGQADLLDRRSTSQDVREVAEQLAVSMRAELAAAQNPERAEALIVELKRAKERADALKQSASRWQTTLNDGVADLQADIGYDLEDRMRTILRQAEQAIEEEDPATIWDQFSEWVHQQVATAASANFVWANQRARWLAERVAEHFAQDGENALPQLPSGLGQTGRDQTGRGHTERGHTERGHTERGHTERGHTERGHTERGHTGLGQTTELGQGALAQSALDRVAALERPKLERLGIGQQLLTGLRGGYGGMLMIGMATSLAGLAMLNPLSAAAGLLLGGKSVRDEKKRQLERRQSVAKSAVRQHIQDIKFQVGKDSRDLLRQLQRTLRDHFSTVAEELSASLAESVRAAQRAVQADETTRARRIRDLKAELERVAALDKRAQALAGDPA